MSGREPTVGGIARRFGVLAVGEALNKGLRLAAFVYAAKALGRSGFGVLNLSIVAATYAMAVANAGLSEIAVRDIARDRSAIVGVVKRVLGLRALLGTGAYGVLFVSASLVDGSTVLVSAIRLYGLIVFPFAITTEFVFRGLQEMHHIARIKVISGAAYLALFLGWVRGPDQVLAAAGMMLLADTLGIVYIAAVYVHRFGWPGIGVRRHEILPSLRTGWPIGVSLLLASMPYTLDTLLLGALRGVEAVGLYNAASRLVSTFNQAWLILGSVLFPMFSRLHHHSRTELADLVSAVVRLVLLAVPPLAALGMVLATPLLLLLYGPEFAEAAPAMRLLLIGAAFAAVNGILMPCILACDGQSAYLGLLLGHVGVNLLLNLVTIPHLGANGCAVAAVSSEGLLVVAAAFVVSRLAPRARLGPIALATPATVAMGACILALADRPAAAYAAGVAVYGLFLAGLGMVSPRRLALFSGRPRPTPDGRSGR